MSSYTWTVNRNGTITVSFNCGDEAPNNIDTAPTKTVKKGTPRE